MNDRKDKKYLRSNVINYAKQINRKRNKKDSVTKRKQTRREQVCKGRVPKKPLVKKCRKDAAGQCRDNQSSAKGKLIQIITDKSRVENIKKTRHEKTSNYGRRKSIYGGMIKRRITKQKGCMIIQLMQNKKIKKGITGIVKSYVKRSNSIIKRILLRIKIFNLNLSLIHI